MGAITSFKATKADTFVVEFDKAQPAAVTAEVTKGTSKVDLKATWNEGRTAVTLVSTGKLTTGEYTVTVKNGEASVTAKTNVEDEKVTAINITSPTALTGAKGTEAYIYYDVVNQYGDSMRTSTSINWTISSSYGTPKVDTSTGKITIKADDKGEKVFTYGTDIYIVGVNVKSGVSVNTSIKIGMEQAVDSVKFAGFVSKDAKTKKVESLPKNFTKDTYSLLFTAYDQNGNPYSASDVKSEDLTFISNKPLLVDSAFKFNDNVYTIDGEDYASVSINPGQYVDKGGEVTITVVANKTGKKTEQVFVIGETALLKSLVLSAPNAVVADGDKDVKIPFVATDVNGNAVTSYETIVRSSNSLTLTASEGSELKVKEENDGTAGIYWTDSSDYIKNFKNASAYNDIDRSISLSTIVVGGESNNLILNVSDARRPVAIKSVKLNDDDNDAIVSGNTATVEITKGNDAQIKYIDQYNADLADDIAEAFFKQAATGFGTSNDKYVISIKTSKNNDLLTLPTDKTYDDASRKIEFSAKEVTTEESVTVRYSIATENSAGNLTDVSKVKSVAYTIVPRTAVANDLTIVTNSSLYKLDTDNSDNINGTTIPSGSSIRDDVTGPLTISAGDNKIVVKGKTRNNLTLTLPASAYEVAAKSAINVANGVVTAASSGAIAWYELYDANSAKYTRINATKPIVLTVYKDIDGGTTVSKNITISDSASAPASIEFWKDWAAQTAVTLNPSFTEITGPKVYNGTGWSDEDKNDFSKTNGHFGIIVKDQYGNIMDDPRISVALKVADLTESTTELTHLTNSFTVSNNGSAAGVLANSKLKITGAEIGDKFKLTATIEGTAVSKDIPVTVGADTEAYVSTAKDADKDFRTGAFPAKDGKKPGLGMNR